MLNQLSATSNFSLQWNLPLEHNKLQALTKNCFFISNKVFAKELNDTHPKDLSLLLQHHFITRAHEDPLIFIDRLSSLLSCELLQESVKDRLTDPLKQAQRMLQEAKIYIKMSQCPHKLSTKLHVVLDRFVSLIENILNAFGIEEFFRVTENHDIRGELKTQKLLTLFILFGIIIDLMLPILGAATGGVVIGSILLTIAILSILWPLIKPSPVNLPFAENLTQKIRQSCVISWGRKSFVDEIANSLKIHRHPCLTGSSCIGKDSIIKEFTAAVERGDYPWLKGKKVYCINTTDLLGDHSNYYESVMPLQVLSESMGKHRNDIILVLNEVHMACKNNEKIADQLKTFLDEGGEFPYVIGITTEKNFSYMTDNESFSKRFKKIKIENTSKEITVKILAEKILKHTPKLIVQPDVLDYLYEKSLTRVLSQTEELPPQPYTALELLKECINKVEDFQQSKTRKEMFRVSEKIASLHTLRAVCSTQEKNVDQEIEELEKELYELQQMLTEEEQELKKIIKLRELFGQATQELYSSVLKIASFVHRNLGNKDKKELNRFLLLREFLIPALKATIEKTATSLGFHATIDKALVDQVCS